jgi:uncharacterized protein with ParB-like and HNH nuclease domain
MQTSPVSIIEYFNGEKQSLIPIFQRPYSWEEKHWRALWDDIMAIYDDETDSLHFIGAIVSVPVSTVPVGVSKHLVIDGQQRLTTLALLLCALRDHVQEKTAARIDDYLVNRHHDEPDRLKLLPTQVDRDAYKAIVAKEATENFTGHGMMRAVEFFSRNLQPSGKNGDVVDAERLFEVVRKSLQVVMINLGDADDPYLIFESLNNKGQPLDEADLVRNYVLMRFKHSTMANGDQQRVHSRYWKPLEDALSSSLAQFLRHYVMMDGVAVKRQGIYAAVKARFASKKENAEVEGELVEMVRHGGFYKFFINPKDHPVAQIRDGLSALTELDMTTCYPYLLRVFSDFDAGLISKEHVAACLAVIQAFAVRRIVCGVPTNSLHAMFLHWSKTYDSRPVEHLIRNMSEGKSSRRWPSDEEFRKGLIETQLYDSRYARFVLVALETAHGHKEQAALGGATIEHVLPQTLSEGWKQDLGADFQRIHEQWCNTLGNLTLSAYNGDMGNAPFARKRPQLAASHIELNRWIANQDEWNQKQIVERASKLADDAIRLWRGPGVATDPTEAALA